MQCSLCTQPVCRAGLRSFHDAQPITTGLFLSLESGRQDGLPHKDNAQLQLQLQPQLQAETSQANPTPASTPAPSSHPNPSSHHGCILNSNPKTNCTNFLMLMIVLLAWPQ